MVRDLIAMARVRRLLLEMGQELIPAAQGETVPEQVSLELWVRTPNEDLDGLNPIEMLDLPGGEARVVRLLAQLLGLDDSGAANGGSLAVE